MFEGTAAEEEVDLNNIDYDWVQKTSKPKLLKKALKLLEQDGMNVKIGSYYPELMKKIEEKLCSVDEKKKQQAKFIDPMEASQAKKEVQDWEAEQKKKSEINIFSQDVDGQQKRKNAENEKIKGNEAMKSNDLQEALQYYTKSIEFDNTLVASYCNRALVHLKMKNFDKCINDCNDVLKMDANYLKAYHRRGKAYMELKKYEQAVNDFQVIMEKEPNNSEVNGELKNARTHLEKEGGYKGFKKIAIVEEEESDNEIVLQLYKETDLDKFDKLVAFYKDQKTEAQEKIRQGIFPEAIDSYKTIFNAFKSLEVTDENVKNLAIREFCACANNIALCFMQAHEHQKVIEWISVIEENKKVLDENMLVKAYLRRGLAYERLENILKAREDFRTVKSLDMNNKQASDALHRLRPSKEEAEQIQQKRQYEEIEKQQQLQKEQQLQEQKKQELQNLQKQESKSKKEEKRIQEQEILVKQQEQKFQQDKKALEEAQLLDNTFFDLENLKQKGNDYYKKGDITQALEAFSAAINFINENDHLKSLLNIKGDRFQTLFIQLQTNSALCQMNQKNYLNCIQNCDHVLQIDQSNLKALYRRGLSLNELANTESDESKQFDIIFKAKIDLEYVYIHENQQNVKGKLDEVVRKYHALKSKLNISENQQVQKENQKIEDEIYVEEIKDESKIKNFSKTNVDQKFLNSVTDSIVGSVIEDLISNDQLPQTSSSFEKNCQAFKKNIELLMKYLKKIPFDHFIQIFSKKEMTSDNVMQIVSTFISGYKDDPQFTCDFLEAMGKTNKYNLVLKMLTKSEKQKISNLIGFLQKSNISTEQLQKYYSFIQ